MVNVCKREGNWSMYNSIDDGDSGWWGELEDYHVVRASGVFGGLEGVTKIMSHGDAGGLNCRFQSQDFFKVRKGHAEKGPR